MSLIKTMQLLKCLITKMPNIYKKII